MIKGVKLLQNIGTFSSDSAAALLEFKKLTLIYGGNARGKTTVAAIFRSLAKNDPLLILGRHRFGSQHAPKVVLSEWNKPSDLIFQEGTWNRADVNVKVSS